MIEEIVVTDKVLKEIEEYRVSRTLYARKQCIAEGCNRKSKSLGFCLPHYNYRRNRLKKGIHEKDIVYPKVKQYIDVMVCKEIDCNKQEHRDGYCVKHLGIIRNGITLKNKRNEDITVKTRNYF